jgi:hypothetical protein
MFIESVELVDLDDCKVLDKRLHCNSNDMDDDDVPNLEGMDVGDNAPSYLQIREPDMGTATELMPAPLAVSSEPPSKASTIVVDLLFNAAGKAPHPDAVIVKHEAGWFQMHEEKRQKKNAEKLALQNERKCLAKDTADARNQLALLLQLIQLRLGGNIDALLSSNLQVPMPLPSLSTGAPSLPRVLSVVIALARRASSSQSSSYIPKESVFRPSISKSLTHLHWSFSPQWCHLPYLFSRHFQ